MAMKYNECITGLKDAQQADHDNRIMVREADHFVNKRDGQWEPKIVQKLSGKPRYTFDECNPIIDDIMGEMEQMDFAVTVTPGDGIASKQSANYFAGIIRNIENSCGASHIYNAAGRIMVGTGFSAWRVVTEYADNDSFDQELRVKQVPNAQDSVWFDPGAVEQSMKDAGFAYVLTSMTKKKYDEKFPKGSGFSVGSDITSQVYSYKKPHEVKVGEYLYRKRRFRELALLTNQTVVAVDKDFMRIKDDLSRQGITVAQTRKRPYYTVFSCYFDGKDWLEDENETVFEYVPIVPVYGNFRISEDKVIYWGVIEKLMDPQRVINYAESRKIEEGALSPRGKYWATRDQVKSDEVKRTMRTLNTNSDPVQFYDWAEGQPPPEYKGAPQSNPGLVETSQSAQMFIQRTSGTFDEARGAAPTHRSGVAIDKLQTKSDNPKRKWFTSMEIALTHTADIFIHAIPKVYDTPREMQIVAEDGTTSSFMMKQKVVDQATGEVVEINDLSKGKYTVVRSAGPAFHSRQQETVSAITDYAQIDPTILQIGGDVLLNNISAPGMDKIAERKRLQMLQAGLIPETQQTEQEKKLMEQIRKQPKEPDAAMVLAKAEQAKADAKREETQMKSQIEGQKNQLKAIQLQMEKEKQDREEMFTAIKYATEEIQAQANALKIIREALGVESILAPEVLASFKAQGRNLRKSVTSASNNLLPANQ